MVSRDKFKVDAFHISLKHNNKLVSIFFIGEKIDTTRREAIHRCAVVFAKAPTLQLINDLNSLRPYDPAGLTYANDIDGVTMLVERFADQAFYKIIQNPFKFMLHSIPDPIFARQKLPLN